MATASRPRGSGTLRGELLDASGVEAVAEAWDAMPAARGLQADFYDTHAWLAAWLRAAGPEAAGSLRVAAALEGDRPAALLPMRARSARRWEAAGREFRNRFRPVLGAEEPDAEALGVLAESAARAGARELVLHRLPSRDPATAALLEALTGCGFRVHRRPRGSDYLALVEGGWEAHRRRFAGFDRTARSRVTKARSLWDLTLDAYGEPGGAPAIEGLAVYLDLHRASWKGALAGPPRAQREELVRRMQARGRARVYVLRAAGTPVAAHLWFRVGPVAAWRSTVYDRRMAALSPGTIIMWWAQERIFAEEPPRLLDLLPGGNPQKDRLAPDRAPLLEVEAARGVLAAGVTMPIRRQARRIPPALRARLRPRREGRRPPVAPAARTLEVAPGEARGAAERVLVDAALARYLAVAGGHASPEGMRRAWGDGDEWWRVGGGPDALVRLAPGDGGPRAVREVVLLPSRALDVRGVLAALAGALGAAVRADLPTEGEGEAGPPSIPVAEAPLPWPGGSRPEGGAA